MTFRSACLCIAVASLTGCVTTGHQSVVPAKAPQGFENTIVVPKKRAEVWASAIPKLGKQFFVINNLDQASGLINVSYSGDPERYVDGGIINTHVEAAGETRDYSFPATSAVAHYAWAANQRVFLCERKMNLEGRVNLILEEVTPDQTRVTANVRYILTKSIQYTLPQNGQSRTVTDTAAFNSGRKGNFPNEGMNGPPTDYWPTGQLEAELLAAFK